MRATAGKRQRFPHPTRFVWVGYLRLGLLYPTTMSSEGDKSSEEAGHEAPPIASDTLAEPAAEQHSAEAEEVDTGTAPEAVFRAMGLTVAPGATAEDVLAGLAKALAPMMLGHPSSTSAQPGRVAFPADLATGPSALRTAAGRSRSGTEVEGEEHAPGGLEAAAIAAPHPLAKAGSAMTSMPVMPSDGITTPHFDTVVPESMVEASVRMEAARGAAYADLKREQKQRRSLGLNELAADELEARLQAALQRHLHAQGGESSDAPSPPGSPEPLRKRDPRRRSQGATVMRSRLDQASAARGIDPSRPRTSRSSSPLPQRNVASRMSIGEAYDRVHASRRSRRDDDDEEDEDEDDDDDEDEDEDGQRPLSRGVSSGRGGQTASSVALKEILKKKVTTVINSRPPGLPTSDPHDAAANAVFLSKFRTFMSWKKENILKCCASGDEMKLKKALVEQGWQALRQHLIDNTADPGLTFTRSSKSGRDKAAVLPLSNGEVAAFHETALTEYLRTSSGDSGSKYTNEEAVNKFLDAFALRFAPVVETFIAAQAAYLAQRRSDHVDFAAGVAAWKRNKLAINKVAAREHEGVAVRDMEPGFLEFLTFMDDINLFRAAVLTYHIKTFEEFEEFEQRGVFQEYKKGMSRDIAFKPARIARIANQTRKTPRVSANSGTVRGGAGGLSDFGSKQTTSASTYPRWGVQVSVAITGESGKRYLRRHSPATKAARDSRLCKGTCVRCKKSWAPGHKCVPSNVVCPYCDEVVGTSKEPNDHYHPWSECHRRLADGGSSDDVFPVQRPYGGGRGGHAGRGRGCGDRGRGRGRGGRSSSWQGDRRGGHAGGGAVSTSSAETVATENPFMGMFVGPARVVDVTTASFDTLTDFYVPVGPCFYVTLELYGGEKVNALVDTGAQHSMITWRCAAKLRDIEAQVGAFQINDVNSGSTSGTLGIVMSVKLTPLGSQAQTRAAEDSIAPAMKLQALVAAKTVKGFGSAWCSAPRLLSARRSPLAQKLRSVVSCLNRTRATLTLSGCL